MSTQINLHPVQARILRALLFKPNAKFSELNLSNLFNDHFTFHIKKLVEDGMVEKIGAKYTLSTKGKEFANRMDTDTAMMERQAKLTVCVVGVRELNGQTQILIQQRLKQPYYGYHGYVSGKMRWGEKIEEAAEREFLEETGLEGKLTLKGIEHKMDIRDGEVLEDKYFYIFKAEKPKGKLVEKYEGGANIWMTEEEIRSLDKAFDDMFDILDLINGRGQKIIERQFQIREY